MHHLRCALRRSGRFLDVLLMSCFAPVNGSSPTYYTYYNRLDVILLSEAHQHVSTCSMSAAILSASECKLRKREDPATELSNATRQRHTTGHYYRLPQPPISPLPPTNSNDVDDSTTSRAPHLLPPGNPSTDPPGFPPQCWDRRSGCVCRAAGREQGCAEGGREEGS